MNMPKDNHQLLSALFSIINQWSSFFKRKDLFHRVQELALAFLLCLGKKTITNTAIFLKRSSAIPTGDYKFFSERTWSADDLFHPILTESMKYIFQDYIAVGVDD